MDCNKEQSRWQSFDNQTATGLRQTFKVKPGNVCQKHLSKNGGDGLKGLRIEYGSQVLNVDLALTKWQCIPGEDHDCNRAECVKHGDALKDGDAVTCNSLFL